MTGIRILANTERLAILTKGRVVRVEKMDELSAVTPYRPASKVRKRIAAAESQLVDSISEGVDPVVVPPGGESF